MSNDTLEEIFLKLRQADYAITSEESNSYNCIAWALNHTTQFWDHSRCISDYAALPAQLWTILENTDNVFSFARKTGETLYNAIDDLRKACMLNIAAKCAATRLSNGKTVPPYIQKIRELRSERFFADVTRELREETKNSVAEDVFKPAPDTLHTPPAGFDRAGSWKTRDQYGNLQLTFFVKGDEWVADIDIDDAAGIEHLFHVLDHKITGSHTHPYAIHEILLARQEIDPGYHFVV